MSIYFYKNLIKRQGFLRGNNYKRQHTRKVKNVPLKNAVHDNLSRTAFPVLSKYNIIINIPIENLLRITLREIKISEHPHGLGNHGL